jgi:hypothetical protein
MENRIDRNKISQKLSQIKNLCEECLILFSKGGDIIVPDKRNIIVGNVNFEMPIRAFIKRYGRSMSSGSRKFVLLLAWLTKGDERKEVRLNYIKDKWEKMEGRSLLNLKFNRYHTADAQENNWVENISRSTYKLTSDWKEIFNNN